MEEGDYVLRAVLHNWVSSETTLCDERSIEGIQTSEKIRLKKFAIVMGSCDVVKIKWYFCVELRWRSCLELGSCDVVDG